MGLKDKLGSIEEGKFADLVLLDENPLMDIRNTRKIVGVFFNDRCIERKTIDSKLDQIAERNQKSLKQYDWKKRKEF